MYKGKDAGKHEQSQYYAGLLSCTQQHSNPGMNIIASTQNNCSVLYHLGMSHLILKARHSL